MPKEKNIYNPVSERPLDLQTIAELRRCPEFAHLDDVTAQKVIDSIKEFCSIIGNEYQVFTPKKDLTTDEI